MSTHATHLCGFRNAELTLNWCHMVVWRTPNLRRDGSTLSGSRQAASSAKIALKYTTSVDIKDCAIKGNSHSFRITCTMSAVSLFSGQQRTAVYKAAVNNNDDD